MSAPTVELVRVARHAMATRFEAALLGGAPERLRAAAEEAFDEVARIESLLSLYRPGSDIGRLNASVPRSPVRLAPETLRLLLRARELSGLTDGAFDPTAGPWIRAWGFMGGTGRIPSPADLAAAQAAAGWRHFDLDADAGVARRLHEDATIDLGAIGKGYALDRAATILRDCGVTDGLLHGGSSGVVGIGTGPGGSGWRVALPGSADVAGPVILVDAALSISAVWGKSFRDGDRELGHVIDPRSGQPVHGARMAAVTAPGAGLADALSTALLVLGAGAVPRIESAFPGARCVAVTD